MPNEFATDTGASTGIGRLLSYPISGRVIGGRR